MGEHPALLRRFPASRLPASGNAQALESLLSGTVRLVGHHGDSPTGGIPRSAEQYQLPPVSASSSTGVLTGSSRQFETVAFGLQSERGC